jgi:hypothetical protein
MKLILSASPTVSSQLGAAGRTKKRLESQNLFNTKLYSASARSSAKGHDQHAAAAPADQAHDFLLISRTHLPFQYKAEYPRFSGIYDDFFTSDLRKLN